MPIRGPTRSDIETIAAAAEFSLTDDQLDEFQSLVAGSVEQLRRVRDLPEPDSPELTRPEESTRTGYRPDADENPHNAWITRCDVGPMGNGQLSNVSIGLKDNVSLAGVEQTLGSCFLEGYTPVIDASVVDDLRNAGATIRGKLNMESFAFSGSGDTSDFGTVTNPTAPGYVAGGSSSGCGAAVASGAVDVAIGTDQGGSIRIPAAWCGIVGLKPTWGLVPYTGAYPLEPTMDTLGPMARTVSTVATALTTIAGTDGIDPRQPATVPDRDYRAALEADFGDLRVGVLDEGFASDDGDAGVHETVRDALGSLERGGVAVEPVSVPRHRDAVPLEIAILGYGATLIVEQGGTSLFQDRWYDTHLVAEFHGRRRTRASQFPATLKAAWLAAKYAETEVGAELYGKAQNVSSGLRRSFDRVFESVDVVAMPTVPFTPFEIDEEMAWADRVERSLAAGRNTAAFNLTGHPAVSVPCGTTEGLPVGLMLVGSRFDEDHLLNIASRVERLSHD